MNVVQERRIDWRSENKSANSFVAAGMAIHAWPEYPKIDADLSKRIESFLLKEDTLCEMSKNSLENLDGKGASRIAAEIKKRYLEMV